MENVLEVQELCVELGKKKIVDKVSFSIGKGQVMGLLGPNGAGKSTIMNAVVGGIGKTSGKTFVFNKDKISNRELKKRMAIVPQEDTFFFDLTLKENLGYFASKVGAPKDTVNNLIEKFDLKKYEDCIAKNLSGGYRKQLNILIGLLQKPDLIFLDEPSVGLDPVLRRRLWDRLFEIKDSGVSVCISTHYMEEAQVLCDKVYLINGGKIIACGSPDELVKQYAKDHVIVLTTLQELTPLDANKIKTTLPWADFSISGASIILKLDELDNTKIQKMKDVLQNLKKEIIKVRQKEADLEQVFINLTGNELKGN